jgi:hypothetical protein
LTSTAALIPSLKNQLTDIYLLNLPPVSDNIEMTSLYNYPLGKIKPFGELMKKPLTPLAKTDHNLIDSLNQGFRE